MDSSIDSTRLGRFLAGEATPQERAEVEAWLRLDPANRELLDAMRAIWDAPALGVPSFDHAAARERMAERLETSSHVLALPVQDAGRTAGSPVPPDRRRTWLVRMAAAAAIAGVALLGAELLDRFASEGGPVIERTFTTQRGERAQIQLADGTEVELNVDSEIRVVADYGERARRVELRGEAFFSVVPDPDRPFILELHGSVVRVLGTRFGVTAYAEDAGAAVVVEEGRVAVATTEAKGSPVVLGTGQRGRVARGSTAVAVDSVDARDHLGWRERRLEFRGVPLRVAVPRLERWYDVEVELAPEIADRRITAVFADSPLPRVLEAISLSLGIDVAREGRIVRLRPAVSP